MNDMTMTTTDMQTQFTPEFDAICKYGSVDFAIGMESSRIFTCKDDVFEKRAEDKSLFENIPDDKPVKMCNYEFPHSETYDVQFTTENADKIMALNVENVTYICGLEMGNVPKICWNESHYEHR
jgi:hypothetical protein